MTSLPSHSAALAEMQRAFAAARSAPPPISGLLVSLRVPYDRVFRQWDTRGRLWVWVNRGALMDAVGPRVHDGYRFDGPIANSRVFGIPVYVIDGDDR